MTSDDTEHTCLVANALIESAGDEDTFRRELARGLRFWLMALPAGVGFATLRATIKLCFGIDPRRSGVFSAGNGPAMKSALLGVCHGRDLAQLHRLVAVSTRITHTDPKAEHAALSVAIAANQSMHGNADPMNYYEVVSRALEGDSSEFLEALNVVVTSIAAGTFTADFSAQIGLGRGPSGYCLHSVPVALHAWLRNPTDYRAAVTEVIRCGGDTDTMAAITGAIVGARVGPQGIPVEWRDGIVDWPLSVNWINAQAALLSAVIDSGVGRKRLKIPFLPFLLRNCIFACVVVGHLLRRSLPPY